MIIAPLKFQTTGCSIGLLLRMSDMQSGLEIANGHLAKVIQGFFEDWNLTNAERDVAIMILKGLDNEAIARVRNTASGTVRAQATNIYAKSETHGPAQFISLFIEELLAGGIGAEGAWNPTVGFSMRSSGQHGDDVGTPGFWL